MKTLAICFVTTCLLCLGFASCGPAGPNCGTLGFSFALQNEILALSAASSAYQQDPSPQNCAAYREAYSNYIGALQGYDKCVPAEDRADWQQSLEEAQQEAANLSC
jgi:hypothetical protein